MAGERYAARGFYTVAALAGLADTDAITLATARFINVGRLELSAGWRMLVIVVLANLSFKFSLVAFTGHRQLLKHPALPFALTALAGIALLLWWPY